MCNPGGIILSPFIGSQGSFFNCLQKQLGVFICLMIQLLWSDATYSGYLNTWTGNQIAWPENIAVLLYWEAWVAIHIDEALSSVVSAPYHTWWRTDLSQYGWQVHPIPAQHRLTGRSYQWSRPMCEKGGLYSTPLWPEETETPRAKYLGGRRTFLRTLSGVTEAQLACLCLLP